MEEAVRDHWIKVAVIPADGIAPSKFEESLFAIRMQDILYLRKVYHAFSEAAKVFLSEGCHGEIIQRRVRLNFVRANEILARGTGSLKDQVFGVIVVSDSASALEVTSLEKTLSKVKAIFPFSCVDQYLVLNRDSTVRQCWIQDGALFSSPNYIPISTAVESIATILVQEISQRIQVARTGDQLYDCFLQEHSTDMIASEDEYNDLEAWDDVKRKLFLGDAHLLLNNGLASLEHLDSAEDFCRTWRLGSLLGFVAKRRLIATMVMLLDRGSFEFETREIYDLQLLFQECIGIYFKTDQPNQAVQLNLIFCKVLLQGDWKNKEEVLSFLHETQDTLRQIPRTSGHIWIMTELCLLYMEVGAWRKACQQFFLLLNFLEDYEKEGEHKETTVRNINKIWSELFLHGGTPSFFKWPKLSFSFLRSLVSYSEQNHMARFRWETFAAILRTQYTFLDRSSQLLIWKCLLKSARNQDRHSSRNLLMPMTEPLSIVNTEPSSTRPEGANPNLFIVNSMHKHKAQDGEELRLVVGDIFAVKVHVTNRLLIKLNVQNITLLTSGARIVSSSKSLSLAPREGMSVVIGARVVEVGSLNIVGCSVDVNGICWSEIWEDTCSKKRESCLERLKNIPVIEEEPNIVMAAEVPSILQALDIYEGQELKFSVTITNIGNISACIKEIFARVEGSGAKPSIDISGGSLPEMLIPGERICLVVQIHRLSIYSPVGKAAVLLHLDYEGMALRKPCLKRTSTRFTVNMKPALHICCQEPTMVKEFPGNCSLIKAGCTLELQNKTRQELEVSVIEGLQTCKSRTSFSIPAGSQKRMLVDISQEELREMHMLLGQKISDKNDHISAVTKLIRWKFAGETCEGSLQVPLPKGSPQIQQAHRISPHLAVSVTSVQWPQGQALSGKKSIVTVHKLEPTGFHITAQNNSPADGILVVDILPCHSSGLACTTEQKPVSRETPTILWHGIKKGKPILVKQGNTRVWFVGVAFLNAGEFIVQCTFGPSGHSGEEQMHASRSYCFIRVQSLPHTFTGEHIPRCILAASENEYR